jgi:hypothetical protein
MTKSFPCLIVLLLVPFLTVSCTQDTKPTPAPRITSRTERPTASWINPHVDRVHVLTVDGTAHRRVRGVKDFYLRVPNTNLIVFVTDESTGGVDYHVYDLDRRKEVMVKADSSLFGRAIGSTSSARQDRASLSGKRLLLCTALPKDDGSVEYCDELDLGTGSLISQKTYFYDRTGKVVEQHDRN